MSIREIFAGHKIDEQFSNPRNRVSFPLITVIFVSHNRNPVSFVRNPQTPETGFLFR
ncbi:hypothetical protein [Planktothricoides sp. SR001]|uniref:hypothetical protein n=1 Tax=Planktothricoides sp. SR001 TaxID=1705388 RepID=UPI0012E117A4|nr:hypothetical protein [Planktothricoides sp. SR001]